jgi:hypothetical protein
VAFGLGWGEVWSRRVQAFIRTGRGNPLITGVAGLAAWSSNWTESLE